MTQLYPVTNAGLLYVNNLQVTRTGNTTLSVAAGQCRDSNNIVDLILSTATTIDTSVSGFGGLDTGTFAASTFYYVYLIGDSSNKNPTGPILSASASTPTLPFDYDSYRLIGIEKTDGSIHFLIRNVVGNGNARTCYWDEALAASVGGSGTATTLTAIDLSGCVPPINLTPFVAQVAFTPAASGDTVGFTPFGSTATAITKVTGFEAAKLNSQQVQLLSVLDTATPKVLYINSAGSGLTALSVSAFTYFI